ncbi:MAG: glutathione S-transferase family protein [Sandaracinaceae bacterium]|nr:glutathione S-transferase family protein [Sandaracinaceae bacterium]
MRLYENAFSPFARKVRMVLEHKQLTFDTIDGLDLANQAALERVNGRVEVPALEHDGVVVVNSADIVAYLERVFPESPAVYPSEHRAYVHARAWERCADTVVDAILVDVSYWIWAQRDDAMPDGLLDRARADLAKVYAALERDLDGKDFVAGALSIADFALFPHLNATRMLQVPFEAARFPRLLAYYKRLRGMEPFSGDIARTAEYLGRGPAALNIERRRIFWRGDRIEWMLAAGQHAWLMNEIAADRVIWPGLGIPGPA